MGLIQTLSKDSQHFLRTFLKIICWGKGQLSKIKQALFHPECPTVGNRKGIHPASALFGTELKNRVEISHIIIIIVLKCTHIFLQNKKEYVVVKGVYVLRKNKLE